MYDVTSAAELEHGSKVFVLRDPSDGHAPSFRVVREATGELSFYWGEPSRNYTGELRDMLYLAVLLHEIPNAQFEVDRNPSVPKPYAIHYAPGAIHYIREHSALEYIRRRSGHRADNGGVNPMSIGPMSIGPMSVSPMSVSPMSVSPMSVSSRGMQLTTGTKRTMGTAIGMILIAIIGLNTTIIAGLQNTLEGTLDLSQSHALCNSTFGLAEQTVSATGASNCSTINGWYSFCIALCWLGGIALALAVAHVFLLTRQRNALLMTNHSSGRDGADDDSAYGLCSTERKHRHVN
jgi:hypothetical protein